MDEQERRGQIRRYFSPPTPLLPVGALVLGGLLVAMDQTGLGIAAIAIGLVLFAVLFGGAKVTDQEIDAWLQEDLARLEEHALQRSGLDLDDLRNHPVVIVGPIYKQTSGIPDEDLLWRTGKDGYARFAANRVTIIFLGEHFLNSFSCDFNFLRNVALNEQDSQYHYKDVVGVSIGEDSHSYTLDTGEKMVRKQSFGLSFTNGDTISVMVSSDELKELTRAELPTSGVERAVSTIRAMLRSKM